MPGTDGERARPAANRLRALICDDPIVVENDTEVTATVSVGVPVGGVAKICASGAAASMIDTTRGQKGVVDRLLGLADCAPHCAKAAGRNRIEVAFTPA